MDRSKRSAMALPVAVLAKPPSDVSFSATGIIRPISFIASMTSSGGMTLRTPATVSYTHLTLPTKLEV